MQEVIRRKGGNSDTTASNFCILLPPRGKNYSEQAVTMTLAKEKSNREE